MATPKKITMYETIFPSLDREKLAVFTFEDGKVKSEFPKGKEESIFTNVIEGSTGKTVTPKDGERFMKALPAAFQMSTIFQFEIED